MKNIVIYILNYIAAVTLYLIVISVGHYLVEQKIVSFRFEWVNYFYYSGLGILTWFPSNYILNHK